MDHNLETEKPKKELSKYDLPEDDESRFNDQKYQGERFTKRYGVLGPIEQPERSFTDILWCIIFLVFMFFVIVLLVTTIANSSVSSLTNIRDSEGNLCGQDDGFQDYRYLFMFKLTSPYKSVCVKECPKFDYNQLRYNSTSASTEKSITPVYFADIAQVMEKGNSIQSNPTIYSTIR